MLVEMPTFPQATRVANVTGWKQLPSGQDPTRLSRRLDAGSSFELHRQEVEAISVLFTLYEPQSDGSLFQVLSG
jgi:hypothetical protein